MSSAVSVPMDMIRSGVGLVILKPFRQGFNVWSLEKNPSNRPSGRTPVSCPTGMDSANYRYFTERNLWKSLPNEKKYRPNGCDRPGLHRSSAGSRPYGAKGRVRLRHMGGCERYSECKPGVDERQPNYSQTQSRRLRDRHGRTGGEQFQAHYRPLHRPIGGLRPSELFLPTGAAIPWLSSTMPQPSRHRG